MDDALRLSQLREVARRTGIALVAAGNVLMHRRSRKPLHDVLTAIKLGCTVHECGFALQANAEAHMRHRMKLAEVYPRDLLSATLQRLVVRQGKRLASLMFEYDVGISPKRSFVVKDIDGDYFEAE